MTLRGALEQLRHQGLVEKRNGIGSFLTQRALRRSGLIGLVIPDYERFEFFAGIKNEVDLHATRLGYVVELAFTAERSRKSIVADIRRKVRHLAENRAEGIIFRPFVAEEFSASNMEIVSALRSADIPDETGYFTVYIV